MLSCLNCFWHERQAAPPVLTVVTREFSKSNDAIDILSLMNTRCFLIVKNSESDGEYGYLKQEDGGLVWDRSKSDTPPDMLSKAIDASIEDSSIVLKEAGHEGYLFDLDMLTENRTFLKATTHDFDISVVCALSPDQLCRLVEHHSTGDYEHFAFEVSRSPEMSVSMRTVGMFAMRYDVDSRGKKTRGELMHVPTVSIIEHTDDTNRKRAIVNSKGQVFVYDPDSRAWALTTMDKKDVCEDIEKYIEDRAWMGDNETAEVNMPVVICGNTGCTFTGGDELTDRKANELTRMSEKNFASETPIMSTKDGSIFKHASSVTLKCMAKNGAGVVDVYKFSDMRMSVESMAESCSALVQ